VIGYHGFGGREFYNPEYCWPVSVGDIIGMSNAVEEVLNLHRVAPPSLQIKADAAREFVRGEYSVEREERDILEFWDGVMFAQGRDAMRRTMMPAQRCVGVDNHSNERTFMLRFMAFGLLGTIHVAARRYSPSRGTMPCRKRWTNAHGNTLLSMT